MRHSNTSKAVSLLLHGIIAVSFLAMGIYFSFFVVPFAFTSNPLIFSEGLFKGSFYLYLEFGFVGLSLALISGYGFFEAYKSYSGKDAEKSIVNSLTAFIVEGWVVSVLLLGNASVFFDIMTSSGSIQFPIIVCTLLAIGLLVGTNIPMVKLYDGKDSKNLINHLVLGFAVVAISIAFDSLLAALGLWSSAKVFTTSFFNADLLTIILGSGLTGALLLTGYFLTRKSSSMRPLAICSASSILSVASTILVLGVLDIVWAEEEIHLVSQKLLFTGYGYGIMSVIVAAVLIIALITALIYAGKGEKAAKKN